MFSGVDENRTCRDCNLPFVFTVSEQEWMTGKKFDKAPTRCKECRKNKRDNQQKSGGYNSGGGYNATPAPTYESARPAPSATRDYRSDDAPGDTGRGRGNTRRRTRDDDEW